MQPLDLEAYNQMLFHLIALLECQAFLPAVRAALAIDYAERCIVWPREIYEPWRLVQLASLNRLKEKDDVPTTPR